MTIATTDKQSTITFPGQWINGIDRNKAFQEYHVLSLICSALGEAKEAALESRRLYRKMLHNGKIRLLSDRDNVKRQIYAKAFIYALDSISKLLLKLEKSIGDIEEKDRIIKNYQAIFGGLKTIRDSLLHIEDRGLGQDKNHNQIDTTILLLGSFCNDCYSISGYDGKHYYIEISIEMFERAKRLVQELVNSYSWK
jgi:hypothetical protein